MMDYDIVDYWNERDNPCSKKINQLTDIHLEYLKVQTLGCKKILDFGPGYGRMFPAYIDGEEVVGVDVTEQHKKALFEESKRQGFNFSFLCKRNNFNHLDFTDKYFDAVVVSEVLFHQTPDIIENMMQELLRIGQKVIVISYMNTKEKYDKLGEYIPSKRYCFNYNYDEICKRHKWNIRRKERFKNQIFFVYSEIFQFKYDGKEIKFLFDRDDYYMSRVIKSSKTFYEIKYLEYLKSKGIVNQNSRVLDVGSYLGNHALYFSKVLNCERLHCFEPTSYSYSILIDNLKINDVKAEFDNVAIGSRHQKISVSKFNPDNPGANQYKYDNSGGVECKTIDSLELKSIDFLKIDVENMEMEVLKGGEFSINKFRPIIMVEVDNVSMMNAWIAKNKYQRIGKKVFSKNTWLLEGCNE